MFRNEFAPQLARVDKSGGKLSKNQLKAHLQRQAALEARAGQAPVSLSIPGWIAVEQPELIGEQRLKDAIRAMKEWDVRFGAERNVVLGPLVDKTNALEKEDKYTLDGTRMMIGATSAPGSIHIGSLGRSRDLVLHEMTHATKPNEPTHLDQPLQAGDGAVVRYHGLTVYMILNGQDVMFHRFEEGMAERNVLSFPGAAASIDPRYIEIAELTRKHFPISKDSKAHEWAKYNDVPSFLRGFLGLDPETPITAKHIVEVGSIYSEAWDRGGKQLKQKKLF